MLRPIDKYIVLEEVKNNTAIFMPNESTDKYKVVSVGPSVTEVSVNSIVLIDSYIKKVTIDSLTLFICKVENILCIVEE